MFDAHEYSSLLPLEGRIFAKRKHRPKKICFRDFSLTAFPCLSDPSSNSSEMGEVQMRNIAIMMTAAVAYGGTVAGAGTASAQQALDSVEVGNRFSEAVQSMPGIKGDQFTVDGTRIYNSPVLAVRKLVFKSGAKLIFSEDAVKERRNLHIFAEEIVSEDAENPGFVGWQGSSPAKQPAQGNGAAGVDNGAREGSTGGLGGAGPDGLTGVTGVAAPSLTVVSRRVNTLLRIDVGGARGGDGGMGGNGGRGGGGGYGSPASQSMVACKAGGGNGGGGGTLTLILEADAVPTSTRFVVAKVEGGPGGKAGEGGLPGAGGPGGPGGADARPFCGGGRNGANGAGGVAGLAGTPNPGLPGRGGAYFVGGLQTSDLDRIFR
jgi:hypothetical protein